MELDFEQLCATMPDALVVCDLAGNITYWNAAATRLFGFTQEEALGVSLDLIIPERQRGRHWEGYHHTMQTGETKYGTKLLQVPAINKAGTPMSIAFTVVLLKDSAGAVTAIASVIREETERFNELRSLKKQVNDLSATQPTPRESR